jgi:hypothetical protein
MGCAVGRPAPRCAGAPAVHCPPPLEPAGGEPETQGGGMKEEMEHISNRTGHLVLEDAHSFET